MAKIKTRTEVKGITFPCRCGNWMKVYKGDKRARGWLRAECKCGGFADMRPESVRLVKRSSLTKHGFTRKSYGWDNTMAIASHNANACSDCMWRNYRGDPEPEEVDRFCAHTSRADFRLEIKEGHLYVLCTKKKYVK